MISCHETLVKYKEDLQIREKIVALEARMLAHPDKIMPDEIETIHRFAPGVYAREVYLPKGIILVGKLHKHEHLNIISKGKVRVITEANGSEYIEAPCTMISPAGTKRIVFALEDTIWTCIHPTNETDVDKIEDLVIAKSYKELGLIDPDIKLLEELWPGMQ